MVGHYGISFIFFNSEYCHSFSSPLPISENIAEKSCLSMQNINKQLDNQSYYFS